MTWRTFGLMCRTLAVALTLTALGGCGDSIDVVDAAPSELDVKVQLFVSSPSGGQCTAQFFKDGKVVQLNPDTTVLYCNTGSLQKMTWLNGFYISATGPIDFDRNPIGVSFSYVNPKAFQAQAIPGFPLPVPVRPSSGASIARSVDTSIEYQRDGATTVEGEARYGPRGDAGGINAAPKEQQDDGKVENLDTSGFPPGPGTVSITKIYSGDLTPTRFKSAHYTTTEVTGIDVIWT